MIKIVWEYFFLENLWTILWLSVIVGVVCFVLSYKFRKNKPNDRIWKILLILGGALTFVLPIILYYIYKTYRPPDIMCYIIGPVSSIMSVQMLNVRKNLLEKHFKQNKISTSVYEKIKKCYGD